MSAPAPLLIIGCGALVRELKLAIEKGGWQHMELTCIPAAVHNTPHLIPELLREKIHIARAGGRYRTILVAFGDCGTAGALDAMLREEDVARIDGAHCYEFFAGSSAFNQLSEEEAGTLYLTDFLVRFFDQIIIRGLGLDRFPHLRDDYFGNYRRVVHLAQIEDRELEKLGRIAAARLDLEYVRVKTGLGGLDEFLSDHDDGSARYPQKAEEPALEQA